MEAHVYTAKSSWRGETGDYRSYTRNHTVAIGAKPALDLSADPSFRGDPALYNPEELLLAALASCHLLSYLALCARNGVNVVTYEDRATGTMAMKDGAIRFTEVLLRPECRVRGNLERARQLHERAHAECFIANSVNFPVRHEAVVILLD
ncbi:MAG: OsmC family protein [Vulcanimicrobiaceae bacterium]